MDIKDKTNRATLKGYFVKNAIPTQANFEDLIDGLVNQADDGIAKLPGEPLSMQPDKDDAGIQTVLNFYKKLLDPKPAWTLSLNPRTDPAKENTAKPGWSIGDKDGNSKLFIDEKTGNVGIGKIDPGGYKLNVDGAALFTGNYLYVNSENVGRLRVGAAWGMPGLYSGDDGSKPLVLGVPHGEKVYMGVNKEDAFVEGGSGNAYFKGRTGIGTKSPAGTFEVNGTAVISDGKTYATQHGYMATGSLAVGSIKKDYGGGRGWHGNMAGLLFETRDNTEIAVHDSGSRVTSLMYFEGDDKNRITIGRDMGWGSIAQLVLNGDVSISGKLIRKVSYASGNGPNDGTDIGQIASRVLTITKARSDTVLRIVYCDNLRVNGNNTAARWEIRIDGKRLKGGGIYQDKYGSAGNYHSPTTIMGFAKGIKAGKHRIEIWVGISGGYPKPDAYTGWNTSTWTIEAEEVSV